MSKKANAYAKAAFDYAKAQNDLKSWAAMLDEVKALSHPGLKNPTLDKETLLSAFDALTLNPAQTAWIELLIDQHATSMLPMISELFFKQYHQEMGIVCVEVITATPLTKTQQSSVTKKLKQQLQKEVNSSFQTNPAILGGVQFEFDGKRVDHSLAHILKQMYLNR